MLEGRKENKEFPPKKLKLSIVKCHYHPVQTILDDLWLSMAWMSLPFMERECWDKESGTPSITK